jgi:hypothetical protein
LIFPWLNLLTFLYLLA